LRQFCIIIIISFVAIFKLAGQSLDELVAYADTQYQEKNYDLALTQFKRVLFFDETEKYGYVHHRIADCYFAKQNFNRALFEYSIAYNVETIDSVKNELTFKKILIYTLLESNNDAISEILSLNDSLSDYFTKKKSFYWGVANIRIDSVLQSKANFIQALGDDTISIQKIQLLFKKYHPNRPNPKLAKALSAVLPGLGQWYIGDYKNAINSLVLNGSLISLMFMVAINYTFIDATIAVFPQFQRYYFGGIKKVGIAALKKKEDNKNKLLNSIFKLFADRKKQSTH
jgi:hypothetical protein